MIAWNGHGFEIVAGQEEAELLQQEQESRELIRHFERWRRYDATPKEREEMACWQQRFDEHIRRLAEQDLESWYPLDE